MKTKRVSFLVCAALALALAAAPLIPVSGAAVTQWASEFWLQSGTAFGWRSGAGAMWWQMNANELLDSAGKTVLKKTETASAVNAVGITNAATGNAPILAAQGTDTNIDLDLRSKGTGKVKLTGPVQLDDATTQSIFDTNGNKVLTPLATASAVNEVAVRNAATAGAPSVEATGTDTNVGLQLRAKGTGTVVAATILPQQMTAQTLAVAGNETYTDAMMTTGILLRDPNGGSRTDTTRTAAQLVAALPGVQVGSTYIWILRNTADDVETITLSGGNGVTISGTATIAQSNSKVFLVRFDNITAASEAVTIYSIGTMVH